MINNLSIYNQWKKNTLDRMTGKSVSRIDSIFRLHLDQLRPFIERALNDRADSINPHDNGLDDLIEKILVQHQHETVYVGVSDGIREVTPEKKLSTWLNYPINMPVENTFIDLASNKQRNSIGRVIFEKLNKDNRGSLKDTKKAMKKYYLDSIKSVFRDIAKGFYGDEDNTDTAATVKEIISKAFRANQTRSEAIFRTETTRYFNDARSEYFKKNTTVDFVQLFAVTDGRTSAICESRDMYVIPIGKSGQKKYKPPFHVNCRTIQSPLHTDIKSHAEEVRRNLGSEFGKVKSETSGIEFIGRRAAPKVALPKGWV